MDSPEPLIDEIYEAAMDDARWPDVLRSLQRRYNLVASTLVSFEPQTRAVQAFMDNGLPKEAWANYASYYFRLDQRLAHLHVAPVGRPILDNHVMTEAQMDQSEFHQGFLRPYDIRWSMTMKSGDDHLSFTGVTLMRAPQAGPFGEAELADYGRLAPHLCRATRIAATIGWSNFQREMLQGSIDRLQVGVIFVDGGMRPLAMNDIASRLVAARDGIEISLGCIRASRSVDDDALRQQFAVAVGRHATDPVREQRLLLQRPNAKRPLSVVVAPCARALRSVGFAGQGAGMLLIADPETRSVTPAAVLRQVYGLTNAEANLAMEILKGTRLSTIADQSGIAVSTARRHLHAVFRKTGASRQAELVAQLMRTMLAGQPLL